jgi:hypothetical protein
MHEIGTKYFVLVREHHRLNPLFRGGQGILSLEMIDERDNAGPGVKKKYLAVNLFRIRALPGLQKCGCDRSSECTFFPFN